MGRFIISHRLAGGVDAEASAAALLELESELAGFADIHFQGGGESGVARRRFHIEAEPHEVEAARTRWHPHILAEPEIERHPAVVRYGDALASASTHPGGLGQGLSLSLRGAGRPLVGASVTLVLAGTSGGGTTLAKTSDGGGRVSFAYNPSLYRPTLALVEPRNGFWRWWQVNPQPGMSIQIPALPKDGPLAWWHQVVGVTRSNLDRGSGIRVGVVDTGVGPHPFVDQVKSIGAVIQGRFEPGTKAGRDAQEHGTHVSGIIAARPTEGSGEYEGTAAGADVSMIRVFQAKGGASQGDIAEAIELHAIQEVDLINLSLGSAQPSEIERDAILLAAERGALCFCASGNDFGQPVIYPAAYPETVAVSAVGLSGTAPTGSTAAHTAPKQQDRYAGRLFLADFSNVGPQTVLTAPGVGIISTVPARSEVPAPYGELSGTSMASPLACAAAATLLAEDRTYAELPRGVERVQRASLVVRSSLRPLGLSPIYVGGGLAQAWPG